MINNEISQKRYKSKIEKKVFIKDNKPKFDIWSLYDLQTSFIKEIRYYQLNTELEKKIINWEKQKIKILRYNLDSFYTYKIFKYKNILFVHHMWHGELFDVDQYDININNIEFKNAIEYTLGNIFDMIMNKVISKVYDLNNNLIISIIINIYPFARFNYKYFKYIYDNCQYTDFKNKIGSRILLYDLINEERNE